VTARDTIGAYNRGFREFTEAYEAFGFADIHAGAMPFLPKPPGLVLDVGAGSGRDADWFAAQGFEVVAVEPAAALRAEAARLHPSPLIRWLDDRLPALAGVHRLGLGFDLVWVSAVWQHMPPEDRPRAMRKLATLLKPGGRMVMTLRHGPAPADRPMWPVDAQEVERLGLDHGLALRVATERSEDRQGRSDVRWQTVVLDLPDDGAGALPLLRSVILRQERFATYKLALLRCIARIADASPNVAEEAEDHVVLPLGLVALYWLRMYKPLVERGLPQAPAGVGLAFVKDAFHGLRPIAPQELRPGGVVAGDAGMALRQALGDAARVIANMPARHLTFADDTPVFPAEARRLRSSDAALPLTTEVFWALGRLRVPLHVWQAMRRMAAWIEPMLLAAWVQQTRDFATRAGGTLATDDVLDALRWLEPERDTLFVRNLAATRLARGERIDCVWTGERLRPGALDVDHCLPWSAWACNDLWNLLPAAPAANRSKSDRIIAAPMLAAAKPRILDWWQRGYVEADSATRARFAEEARTTLPLAQDRAPDLDDLFAALEFRRLRLRQDTQLPEWHPSAPASGQAGGPAP
jgi:SAM-dependent methyltransferase